MTDSPTPSTPQPLLSASSYCALIAADTAEAATLRRLIADSQGTTLAINTSPQDAVELRTDPADARGAGLPHRDGEPRLVTQDRRLLPRPRRRRHQHSAAGRHDHRAGGQGA